jgi:hypothetical protein
VVLLNEDGDIQTENPQPDSVWFWYDPQIDSILQHETRPYNVQGVFDSEQDAHRFLDWYSAHYAVQDLERFELYSAELSYQGAGDESPFKEEIEEGVDIEEITEQAGFDSYEGEAE